LQFFLPKNQKKGTEGIFQSGGLRSASPTCDVGKDVMLKAKMRLSSDPKNTGGVISEEIALSEPSLPGNLMLPGEGIPPKCLGICAWYTLQRFRPFPNPRGASAGMTARRFAHSDGTIFAITRMWRQSEPH
jgi:hypothetical protein